MGYPEHTILAVLAKYPNRPFWANLGVPINAKMVGLNYGGQNHDPTVRTEPLNSKQLTL